AHFQAARRNELRNVLLGIPVVILSAVVGATVAFQSSSDTRVKAAVGTLSVIAGILASLQTFLRHAERAEKHRIAAVRYGSLRRELEEVFLFRSREEPFPQKFVESFRMRWAALDRETPMLPGGIVQRVAAERAAVFADSFGRAVDRKA
ncbi:MAG TPA: SLATT domain-containing protein, partial [Longimicrobiaceae bacterium]|nr:SLATT domain-containing protein [Longimicrobiaceae bacterium]